jgi:hypothetical protein
MKPIDVCESSNRSQIKRGKPYVAPNCRRVTPDEAKEWLLRRADPSDPEVRSMLESIEAIRVQEKS